MFIVSHPDAYVEHHPQALQSLNLKYQPSELQSLTSMEDLRVLLNSKRGVSNKDIYIRYTLALLKDETCLEVFIFLENIELSTKNLMLILQIKKDDEWRELIQSKLSEKDSSEVFASAIEYNESEIIKRIVNIDPTNFWSLIQRNNFSSLHLLIRRDNLRSFVWLLKKISNYNQLLEALKSQQFQIFYLLASKGYLSVFKWLIRKATELFTEINQHDHYVIFGLVVSHGYLPLVKFLSLKAENDFLNMVVADNFRPWHEAAGFGHLKVLRWFSKILPEFVEPMLRSQDFAAFRAAAKRNHVDVLEWITEKIPQHLTDMIEVQDYSVARKAKQNNFLDVFAWIFKHASREQRTRLEAIIFDEPNIINWSLLHPDIRLSDTSMMRIDWLAWLWSSTVHGHKDIENFILTSTKYPFLTQWRENQMLLDACHSGWVSMIHYCLEMNYTHFINQALCIAAQKKRYDLFLGFIQHGADVELTIKNLESGSGGEFHVDAIRELRNYTSTSEETKVSSLSDTTYSLFSSYEREGNGEEEEKTENRSKKKRPYISK